MIWSQIAMLGLGGVTLASALMLVWSKHSTHAIWYLFLVGSGVTAMLFVSQAGALAAFHFLLGVVGVTGMIYFAAQLIGQQESPPTFWSPTVVGLPVLLLGSLLLLSFQQSPARPQQTQSTSQGTKSTTTHQHKQPHQARGMLDTLTLMAQELSTKHFLAFGLLSILLIVVFVSLLTIQQMTLEDPPHNAVSRSSSQQQPRT